MIKCPNCGSTAQIKLVESYHYNTNNIAEEYECGCGAKLIQHYALVTNVVYTKDKVHYIKESE